MGGRPKPPAILAQRVETMYGCISEVPLTLNILGNSRNIPNSKSGFGLRKDPQESRRLTLMQSTSCPMGLVQNPGRLRTSKCCSAATISQGFKTNASVFGLRAVGLRLLRDQHPTAGDMRSTVEVSGKTEAYFPEEPSLLVPRTVGPPFYPTFSAPNPNLPCSLWELERYMV